MPIQISVPKYPNFAGGGAKPPRVLATWLVQGEVINSIGLGVGGVRIKFIDKDDPSATPKSILTDTAGKFGCWVSSNNAGYRAEPYNDFYIFCPSYFDFWGNSPIMHFNAVSRKGDEVQPK